MLTSSRLFAKKFNFDKNSSIKQTIYQKLDNSNGNTFSFISHECSFSYHPRIVASKTGVQQLFSAKIKDGEETQPQEHQHPCPILLDWITPPLTSLKTMKNLTSIRKLKHARHGGLCIFVVQMLNAVSISFIDSELIRTLYLLGLLLNLQWKQ